MESEGEAVPQLGEDLTYCEAFKVRRASVIMLVKYAAVGAARP